MGKTIAQAIADLAGIVKGEPVATADGTKVAAIDALIDAMTGEDVPVPEWSTIADAIDVLAANYTPGGGGVDVGPLVFVGCALATPTVGGSFHTSPYITLAKIGDVAIYDNSALGDPAGGSFAAGLTLTTDAIPTEYADTMNAYVCTVDGSNQYATVELWDGTLTREDTEYEGDPAYQWTFTVPELQEGEALVFHVHTDI